jgi:predicted nucleic acid-binding protein
MWEIKTVEVSRVTEDQMNREIAEMKKKKKNTGVSFSDILSAAIAKGEEEHDKMMNDISHD